MAGILSDRLKASHEKYKWTITDLEGNLTVAKRDGICPPKGGSEIGSGIDSSSVSSESVDSDKTKVESPRAAVPKL